MFDRERLIRWRRGDRLSGEDFGKRGWSNLKVNRRQLLLGGPAVLAGTAAPLHASPVSVLSLGIGGHLWRIHPSAFGLASLPAPTKLVDGFDLVIPRAAWPGTPFEFDILIQLREALDGHGRIRVLSRAMGWDGESPFSSFIEDGLALSRVTSADINTLATGLGWIASGAPGEVRFLEDCSWLLSSAKPFQLAKPVVSSNTLYIRAHGPGAGPLDPTRSVSTRRSTSITAIELAIPANFKLVCGTTFDGQEIILRATHFDEVVVERWDRSSTVTGLNGSWRLDLRRRRFWGGGFRSVGGLVLIADGAISARLPIDPTLHQVTLPGGTAGVVGADDEHVGIIEALAGRVIQCELRCCLATMFLPMDDVDLCMLELDDTDVSFVLDGRPDGGGVFAFFGLATWRLPMEKSRLRIARSTDMMSLRFSFQGMDLVHRPLEGWHFEAPDNAPPPLMRVEFPPQHVMEQAFLQQIDNTGSSNSPIQPNVQVDSNKVLDEFGSPENLDQAKKALDPDYPKSPWDTLKTPAGARLAEPSRLVFQLPFSIRRGKRRVSRIPLKVDALTAWEGLALNVPGPAKTLEVQAGSKATAAQVLDFHGVRKTSNAAIRMRDVVSQIRQPAPFETTIEMPARLALSPSPSAAFSTAAGRVPLVGEGPVALWSTTLAAGDASAVRAVWSPDFKSSAFLGGEASLHGTTSTWTDEAGDPLHLPMDDADRHELVSLSSLFGLPILPRLPASLPAQTDSSNGFANSATIPPGYALGGFAKGDQGIYFPPSIPVKELTLTALGGSLDAAARFEPPAAPFSARTKSLFPALNVEAWNQQTMLGRDESVEVIYKGFLFPLGHRASLVKLTERYFRTSENSDRDDGPVAFLVQRYFIRIAQPNHSYPGLGQPFDGRDFPVSSLQFRTTRTPDIVDPTRKEGSPTTGIYKSGQIELPTSGTVYDPTGIGTPFSSGQGTAFWPRTAFGLGNEVQFSVAIPDERVIVRMPLLFVDNTAAHDHGTVAAITDYYQNLRPSSGLNVATLGGAAKRYAPETKPRSTTFPTARWVLGAKGRLQGDTVSYAMDGAMEGADQPPVYPYVREAHVSLQSIQQFSSRSSDLSVVSFDKSYVASGTSQNANPAKLYLSVHGYLPTEQSNWYDPTLAPVRMDMGDNGDRSGGIAQPNVTTVALSIQTGVVGGQTVPVRSNWHAGGALPLLAAPAPATGGSSAGIFTGLDFFPADAKLLGIIPLRDIVKTALMAAAPQLLEDLDAAEDALEDDLAAALSAIRSVVDPALDGVTGALQTAKDQLNDKIAGVTVAQLYPRVATTLQGVIDAASTLRKAVDAAEILSQIRAVVTAVKSFNQCCTDFVAELDRVAHDPLPSDLDTIVASITATIVDFAAIRGSILFDTLTKQAKPLLGKVEACQTAVALWIGPDAYKKLTQAKDAADLKQVIEGTAATAADALGYELVGRPLLETLARIEKVEEDISTAAAADIRLVMAQAMSAVAKLLDATLAAAQSSVVGRAVASADSLCQSAGIFLTNLDSTLCGTLDSAEAIIADVAELLVAADQASTVNARHVRRHAIARRLNRKSASASFVYATQQAAAASTARASAVACLTKLNALVGSMRDAVTELQTIAPNLLKQCLAEAEIDIVLGRAQRWMNLRLQAVGQVELLVQHLAEGLAGSDGRPLDLASDAYAAAIARALDAAAPLVKKFTTLEHDTKRVALNTAAASLVREMSTCYPGGAEELQSQIDGMNAAFQKIVSALTTQQPALKAAIAAGDAVGAYAAAQGLTNSAQAVSAYSRECERRICGALLLPLSSIKQSVQDALIGTAAQAASMPVKALWDVYTAVRGGWDAVIQEASQAPAQNNGISNLDLLRLILRPELIDLFTAGKLYRSLVAEAISLSDLYTNLSGASPNLATASIAIDKWRKQLSAVGAKHPDPGIEAPALWRVGKQLADTLEGLAQGRLSDVFDVDGLRDAIQKAILQLPFSKLSLTYKLETDLNDLPPFFFMARDDSSLQADGSDVKDLTINFGTTLDVASGANSGVNVTGVLQPFKVDIFEVVTLFFYKATFTKTNGGSAHVDIRIADVQLGSAVSFIQELESYLSSDGSSGFYIDFELDPPSVEAGFAIDLGTISFGDLAFMNVSLGASVELPLDNRPAHFKFNLARRDSPFMICAAPYGGGGFLSLIADSHSIVGFEASFEYGAMAAFGIVGIRGQASITFGIYLSQTGSSASISGFFRAAGSAHIACFSISACLLVGFEQQLTGDLYGYADFTFSFSLGFIHPSFSFHVEKKLPAPHLASGSGSAAAAPAKVVSLAQANATLSMFSLVEPGRTSVPPDPEPAPITRSRVVAMDADWMKYRSYFDEDL